MERLDEIVETMEGERLSLDVMVRNYEEGIRLVRHCRRQIDQARQRVERVNQLLDDNHTEVLTAFEVGESAAEEAEAASAEGAGGARGSRRTGRKTAGGASAAGGDDEEEIRLF